MIVLDNKELVHCQDCKTKEVTYKMYIIDNFLYCFKCSMSILKRSK
jgi:late competence protein required for DNA uptake (superfamily II DNA/RNA helicase)